MIFARLRVSGGFNQDYPDIWDLKIDAKSCVGVGFINHEGRQAEFSLLSDAWIQDNIIDGDQVGMGYLPVLCEIWNGETLLISGFVTEQSSYKEEVPGIDVVTIKIADVLCLYFDFAQGMDVVLNTGVNIIPLGKVLAALNEIRWNMPAEIYPGFGLPLDVSSFVIGAWLPYLSAGVALLNWEDEAVFPVPEYSFINDRYYVIYKNASDEIVVEYCLHDELVIITGLGPYSVDYYQHLWWKKWKLVGDVMVEEAASGQQFSNASGTLPSNDQTAIDTFKAGIASLKSGYPITAENGITRLSDGTYGCAINGTELILLVYPSGTVAMKDAESGATSVTVDMATFLADMVKLTCAYLEVVNRSIYIKNKLALPATPSYEVAQEEVVWGSFMRRESERGSINADCSYLKYGAVTADGIEEYYRELTDNLIPWGFEWEVFGGGHTYSIGEVVGYKGYEIMITKIEHDLDDDIIRISGIGGRAE